MGHPKPQTLPPLQMDPQEAQIAALKREVFLLRQENSYLRDQVRPHIASRQNSNPV